MLRVWTKEKTCDMCHEIYTGSDHDGDHCVSCRRVSALERIADVLEYWVGHQ